MEEPNMKSSAFALISSIIIMLSFSSAFGQIITIDKSQKHLTVDDDLTVFSDSRFDVNYKNVPISYWLDYLNDENRYTQASLIEEAAKVLTEAVPLLVYVADPNTTITETKLDSQFRRSAIRALADIIERGVPTLIELMKNDNVWKVSRAAAGALKSMRLRYMADSLDFGVLEKRIYELDPLTSQALSEWEKSEAKSKVEYRNYLLRLLKGPNSSEREFAVLQLLDKSPQMVEDLVPELIKIVQNPVESSHQVMAINSLGKLGLRAKASIPILLEAKKHIDKNVRDAASDALERINKAVKKSQKASSSN
jgi:HEAT repeat protein